MSRCRDARKDGQPEKYLQCCRVTEHAGDCHLHSPLTLIEGYSAPHTYGTRTHGGLNLRCVDGATLDGAPPSP